MNKIFLEGKLGDTVGKKSENLHFMRFVAAIMVIVFHSFFISTGSETGEWFRVLTNNQITMGEFAVAIFFLCGGYLIAMSVERHETAKKYFAARIKRLFPSLFFVTLATVILGSFLSSWKPAWYVGSPEIWKYMLNVFLIRVHTLPGVFETNASAIINGSLWTLRVEFACYILCFIAYKLTLLRKKRFPISIPLVAIGTFIAWKMGAVYPSLRDVIEPVLLFYIGIGYWVYREQIHLTVRNFIVSMSAFVLLFVIGQGKIAMLLAFPYMMMYIWFGIKQCSPKLGRLGNYSYGVYLWGFTVQQTVVALWKDTTMPPMLNALISIPVSIFLGWLTYEFVENKAKGIPNWVKNFRCPDVVYVTVLVLYAMRHVNWGVDLWDTAYSYSNFQYMSFDHMDTMWIFSTYLANVVGNFLTKLPFANNMLGMNFYTTLFVAALPIIGYFFCTRKLKIARWIAFIGGMITLALSWCPSAVLYNYLTYILLTLCVVFIYKGLTENKKWWLFAAGICLGANVLTRFSNLPQAALILAVWIYGVAEFLENKEKGAFKKTLNRTLWCIGGWLTGIGTLLLYIHIRYGIDEYIQGIARLLSMTDNVAGYKPTSMLFFVKEHYKTVFPVITVLIRYVLIGMAVWAVIELLKKYIKFIRDHKYVCLCLDAIGIMFSIALGCNMVERMYLSGFAAMYYIGYASIFQPAVLFMAMTILIAIIRLFQKNVSKEDKLIGIMIAVVVLVSSIGSSNGTYSSFNNLCLAAPYALWHIYQFIRNTKSNFAWPSKAILGSILYVLLWQTCLFGEYFFYTEAIGAVNVVETVDNNEMLEGIKMYPEKAFFMNTLSEYANEHSFKGKEVITFGHVPGVSYYLQMPPAFNSWPDLESYNISQMKLDMAEVEEEIANGEKDYPVVIADVSVLEYYGHQKWDIIQSFMDRNGYECTYVNGKFVVFEMMMDDTLDGSN